jgi:predicted dinucleotide-binding enzyme
MRIGVLGTGTVGRTVGGKLAALGHDVAIGTRDPAATIARTETGPMEQETFAAWHARNPDVRIVPYVEAAAGAELLVNATNGAGSMEALDAAGAENLEGKVLIDISNPLDFSQGMPPSLFVSNTDSLGEQIQRAFPGAKVVKTLNTVTASVMVDPSLVAGGEHTVFVSGDDAGAKEAVTALLRDGFGWRHVVDLGDIATSRGVEMYLPLWLRLFGALGTPFYNVRVVT